MKRILGLFVCFLLTLIFFTCANAQVAGSLNSANRATEKIIRTQQPDKLIAKNTELLASSPAGANSNSASVPGSLAPVSASIYRVGANDVLDIRLSGMATKNSTLYTVDKDGSLEYPLI